MKWGVWLGVFASGALANTHMVGKVYEKDSNLKKHLFNWHRTVTESDGNQHVLVEFRTPEGQELTREEVWYEKGQFKKYTLKKFQNGEDAKVEVVGKKIELAFKEGEDEVQTDSENYDPSQVIVVDQVGQLIRKNWDKLLNGETVKIRYVVPERTETVGFKFFREDMESHCDGKRAVVIKMKPTSIVVSAFVDPLYFSFSQAEGHRLCEYTGRTSPLRQKGSKWEPIDALTIYDPPVTLTTPGS